MHFVNKCKCETDVFADSSGNQFTKTLYSDTKFSFFSPNVPSIYRFMLGDLSDSDGDLSTEPVVKEVEFQGTEETHRAFSHGTELIPW